MNGLKYSIARIAIFLACLGIGWLVGLRDPLILLLVAATVSLLISLFVLAGMRDRFAEDVADRVDHRRAVKEAAHRRRARGTEIDADVEDSEADSFR